MASFPRVTRSVRSAPEKVDLAHLLSYRLTIVANQLSRSQLMRFASIAEISLPEWRILVLVNNFGPLSVKSLSRYAGLDFGQTSRIVSRMSENDLISKERRDDARSVNLTLTTKGRALHRRLWTVAMQSNGDFLESLNKTEREVLMAALDTLSGKAKASIEASERRAVTAAKRAA